MVKIYRVEDYLRSDMYGLRSIIIEFHENELMEVCGWNLALDEFLGPVSYRRFWPLTFWHSSELVNLKYFFESLDEWLFRWRKEKERWVYWKMVKQYFCSWLLFFIQLLTDICCSQLSFFNFLWRIRSAYYRNCCVREGSFAFL